MIFSNIAMSVLHSLFGYIKDLKVLSTFWWLWQLYLKNSCLNKYKINLRNLKIPSWISTLIKVWNYNEKTAHFLKKGVERQICQNPI